MLQALPDTHTEIVGVVEVAQAQYQLLVLPTDTLGGDRVSRWSISCPLWGWGLPPSCPGFPYLPVPL